MTSTRLWRPAVLVKTRVCVGCSLSRAHKTWSQSFLCMNNLRGRRALKGKAKRGFGVRGKREGRPPPFSLAGGLAPKFLALPFRMPATLQASLWKAIITSVALRHSYPFKAFSHIRMTKVRQCTLSKTCKYQRSPSKICVRCSFCEFLRFYIPFWKKTSYFYFWSSYYPLSFASTWLQRALLIRSREDSTLIKWRTLQRGHYSLFPFASNEVIDVPIKVFWVIGQNFRRCQ